MQKYIEKGISLTIVLDKNSLKMQLNATLKSTQLFLQFQKISISLTNQVVASKTNLRLRNLILHQSSEISTWVDLC